MMRIQMIGREDLNQFIASRKMGGEKRNSLNPLMTNVAIRKATDALRRMSNSQSKFRVSGF